MYIFKLKLSEKARGYCMYVFLVIVFNRNVLIVLCPKARARRQFKAIK